MSVASYNGASYFATLFDDSSSVSLVRLLAKRSEAHKAVQDMILELENTAASTVKRSRSDNGTEYISAALKNSLEVKGIQQALSSPYSPESNGKAGRPNRTLNDRARTMITSV